MQLTSSTLNRASIRDLKATVYGLLGCSTTKEVKKAFPHLDLRRRSSWEMIEESFTFALPTPEEVTVWGSEAESKEFTTYLDFRVDPEVGCLMAVAVNSIAPFQRGRSDGYYAECND